MRAVNLGLVIVLSGAEARDVLFALLSGVERWDCQVLVQCEERG